MKDEEKQELRAIVDRRRQSVIDAFAEMMAHMKSVGMSDEKIVEIMKRDTKEYIEVGIKHISKIAENMKVKEEMK